MASSSSSQELVGLHKVLDNEVHLDIVVPVGAFRHDAPADQTTEAGLALHDGELGTELVQPLPDLPLLLQVGHEVGSVVAERLGVRCTQQALKAVLSYFGSAGREHPADMRGQIVHLS